MSKFLPILFLSLASTVFSCKLVDPSEDIPSYLSNDTVKVSITDPLNQGSSSHKISDSWVYVNNDLLGIFEVPYTVPMIASGPVEIQMRAGIKINGVSNTRVIYPFFKPFIQSIDAKVMDTTTVDPVYEYYSNTAFPYLADFENSVPLSRMAGSDTTVVHVKDDNVFEGVGSAGIFLDDQRDFFKVKSDIGNSIKFPGGSPSVFLEMDYKNNTPFYVSLGAVFPTEITEVTILRINPQESWNKIYVNLSPYVRDYNSAQEFYIFFTGTKYPADPPAKIYLDNLKLVHSE